MMQLRFIRNIRRVNAHLAGLDTLQHRESQVIQNTQAGLAVRSYQMRLMWLLQGSFFLTMSVK